jgi:hypothetical protein
MSVAPLTPKVINYLDILPDDIISVIYDMVIISHTQNIEDAIIRLEDKLVVINDAWFFTNYLTQLFTFDTDNNGVKYPVYDSIFHINPIINLRTEFNVNTINIHVMNHFGVRVYDDLAGHIPDWLILDINHEDNNKFNLALIIDYIMRYALSNEPSVYNHGWEYNVIDDIIWDTDYEGKPHSIDGVLNFIIITKNRRWDGANIL